jgi:ethanolamine utilization protein EutN
MFLAKVIGQVVATRKEPELTGRRLVILSPQLVDPAAPNKFKPGSNTVVAVDTLGAGNGEWVLFVQGSSARQGAGLKALPIDAAVIGIVDSVHVQGRETYRSGNEEEKTS